MIFLTLGTHPQQFNRLLMAVDSLLKSGKIREKVVAQIGASDYKPRNFNSFDFIGDKKRERLMKKASLIISHAGAGTIIDALNLKKKIIVVPRLKKFGEHTNDHQIEIAGALEAEGKVLAVYDIANLAERICEAKKFKRKLVYHSRLAKKLFDYLSDSK